jgi:hypothetical protein
LETTNAWVAASGRGSAARRKQGREKRPKGKRRVREALGTAGKGGAPPWKNMAGRGCTGRRWRRRRVSGDGLAAQVGGGSGIAAQVIALAVVGGSCSTGKKR